MAKYEELQQLIIRGQSDKVKGLVSLLLGSDYTQIDPIS